ncbi:MAG: pirin family protein [Segetibacter sp.]|nr:pirin family protein [Segetibacter sp.]
MQSIIHRAGDRGVKDIGWLVSHLSFAFSSYQNPVNRGFGLLKVLNDDSVEKGGGFGLHAHTNMEIISIMLKGKMNHKDSLGYSEVVEEGGVQIMSAGSGLRHEEYNVGNEEVQFLQIWIEPKLQNIQPRYQKRSFPKEKRKNKLQVVVSNKEGVQHCWINQNATLTLGYFETPQKITYTFEPENKCVYVFVLEGQLTINGEQLNRRDAMGVWQTNINTIVSAEETEFLVIEVPINH